VAGDWIRIETTLFGDPRIARIAEAIKAKDPDLALVKVMRVWAHADEHGQRLSGTEDAIIPHTNFKLLDRMAGKPGLLAAMAAVGWAIEDTDGRLEGPARGGGVILPGFMRHQVRLACDRKAEARKNAERARNVRRTASARTAHDERTEGAAKTRRSRTPGGPTRPDQTRPERTRQNRTGEEPASHPATTTKKSGLNQPAAEEAGSERNELRAEWGLDGWQAGEGERPGGSGGGPSSVREALVRLGIRDPALATLAGSSLTVEQVREAAEELCRVGATEGMVNVRAVLVHRLAKRAGVEIARRGGELRGQAAVLNAALERLRDLRAKGGLSC
jgi:hypothetical protein